MCFSAWKNEEMKRNGEVVSKKDAITHVAHAWRSLSETERAYWNEEERNDKLRFVREKAAYKGPWDMPKRRAKKHPLAPKRPMSAFLKYSQTRRKEVKEENPDMSNTDISRLLGEMWRNASPKERAPYQEQEEKERAVYKAEIAKWRADQARIERERALSTPAAPSTTSVSQPEDYGSLQEAKPPSSHVPYEYSGRRSDPLNGHDPNGSHFNQASGGHDFYSYQRSDYHQPRSNGNSAAYYGYPRASDGSEVYSSYHHYYPPPQHHHQHHQQQQQPQYASHSAEDHHHDERKDAVDNTDELQAQTNDAGASYYYAYPTGGSHHEVTHGTLESHHEETHASEQDEGSLQPQQQDSSAASNGDYDVPPPLPPPQMHNEGHFEPTDRSTSRGSFYAQL